MDQCPGEQIRARPDRATPPRVKTSPQGLNLSKLNLKGAAETTVKILLQRKHQRGETLSKQGVYKGTLYKYLILWTCSSQIYDCFHMYHNTQMFSISHSLFIQRKDVLTWRHVAPSVGEGPGMHPVHLCRWPPGL